MTSKRMVYGYLRVSTDKQDVESQKLGVLDYTNKKNLTPVKFVEDTVSGKIDWRNRGIGQIIGKAKEGDVIVASEISRLARSTLQVLELLKVCADKKIQLHITKGQMILDGSLHSTIVSTVLGLVAQIDREFTSKRTKEGLERARKEGKRIGRPKGRAKHTKLDAHEEEIKRYLSKGVSVKAIARLIECAPSTVYSWKKRKKLKRISFR